MATGHQKIRRPPGTLADLPPPSQLHGLDFMLGTYDCRQPGQAKLEVTMSTECALGGHYYVSSITQFMAAPHPNVYGTASYGWNPVYRRFMMQYYDNWGTSGTALAPEWEDGHLRFAGSLLQVTDPNPSGFAQGMRLDITDDRQVVSADCFVISQTVTTPDGKSKTSRLECRRH
jgi:hypothetical protein